QVLARACPQLRDPPVRRETRRASSHTAPGAIDLPFRLSAARVCTWARPHARAAMVQARVLVGHRSVSDRSAHCSEAECLSTRAQTAAGVARVSRLAPFTSTGDRAVPGLVCSSPAGLAPRAPVAW